MMKTIVLTGAASGIGNVLLRELCRENIVFAGYRKSGQDEELKKLSDNVRPFFIDMKNKTSVKLAADFIKTKTSKIDALFNIAGCVVAGAVEKLDVDDIRKQFEVNTFSHLDFSKYLLDLLVGGRIINVSSMSSFGIFPFISPYCASKRAMDILFNSMALETHRNIKIISVKPGVIATPIWEKSIAQNTQSVELYGEFEKEMKFLVSNAHKNSKKGLPPQKLTELLLQILNSKNPKSSYTVGKDAKFAEIFSKLPQDLLNTIIKFTFSKRIKD